MSNFQKIPKTNCFTNASSFSLKFKIKSGNYIISFCKVGRHFSHDSAFLINITSLATFHNLELQNVFKQYVKYSTGNIIH